jgi:hypothetical protein
MGGSSSTLPTAGVRQCSDKWGEGPFVYNYSLDHSLFLVPLFFHVATVVVAFRV